MKWVRFKWLRKLFLCESPFWLLQLGWLTCGTPDGRADQLRIERVPGAVQLLISGEPNVSYEVKACSGVDTGDWTSLLRLNAAKEDFAWLDVASKNQRMRFYRLLRLPDMPFPAATDFRLIDDAGKSRSLYYHTDVRAIVLVLAGNDLANLVSIIPRLQSLDAEFSSRGVLFWIILTNGAMERDQITAQARAMGIRIPVLQDTSAEVTRAFASTSAPEAICVDPADFSIQYRGPLAEELGVPNSVDQTYLADALRSILGGRPVTIQRTAVRGVPIILPPPIESDYAIDIAPILQSKCVICHSPENIGPFAMTNHAVIKEWAQDIKHQILAGNMPPWHADPRYGKFLHDRSLKSGEIARLVQWIDSGALGSGGNDPLEDVTASPPKWPVELGEPDLVIALPPQTIKATGSEAYRFVYVQSDLTTNVWLRAAIPRPSNRNVVHHYNIWTGKSTIADMIGFAIYVPGRPPASYPEGTGVLLPARTWLTFNLHYTPIGEAAVDYPELGLYFHRVPPPKELKTIAIETRLLAIAPFEAEHEVQTEYTFNREVWLRNLYPHMHFRGARMKYEAVYPDGQIEVLLSVPRYEFHWQTSYVFAEPKWLPPGTTVVVSGAFDNSAQNLENPDPTKRVTWGEQSWDEMFMGYMEYTD